MFAINNLNTISTQENNALCTSLSLSNLAGVNNDNSPACEFTNLFNFVLSNV